MKPFNLEEAKAGKPVVTRLGRPVRILCWDAKGSDPIVALIDLDTTSYVVTCDESGIFSAGCKSDQDLFMKSEVKEGWVPIIKGKKYYFNIYPTKETAETMNGENGNFVTVAKIEWEE